MCIRQVLTLNPQDLHKRPGRGGRKMKRRQDLRFRHQLELLLHFLLYGTMGGQSRMNITCGVAQGSIPGPDFWNAPYDNLPGFDTYAGHVPALVTRMLIRQMSRSMMAHSSSFALQKIDVVILTKRIISSSLFQYMAQSFGLILVSVLSK